MSRLLDARRLVPDEPPDLEPWAWLSPSALARWLRVSEAILQTARRQRVGPPWRYDESNHVWYRVADLLHHWGGPASPSGNERIRMRLEELDRAMGGCLRYWPAADTCAKAGPGS